MKIFRAIALLFVTVAILGIINGCQKPCPDVEPCPEVVSEMMGAHMTSKAILIKPLASDPSKCTVVPDPLHMGDTGIKWVTFVNQTAHDAQIKFDVSDTIGDAQTYPVKANESESFKLKNPNAHKEHTYTVAAACYEDPIARPKIIIP